MRHFTFCTWIFLNSIEQLHKGSDNLRLARNDRLAELDQYYTSNPAVVPIPLAATLNVLLKLLKTRRCTEIPDLCWKRKPRMGGWQIICQFWVVGYFWKKSWIHHLNLNLNRNKMSIMIFLSCLMYMVEFRKFLLHFLMEPMEVRVSHGKIYIHAKINWKSYFKLSTTIS